MRTAFRPSEDASYLLRIDNRKKMRELMIHRPFGYGIGLSKGEHFHPKERMPYHPIHACIGMGRDRNSWAHTLSRYSWHSFRMVLLDTYVQNNK